MPFIESVPQRGVKRKPPGALTQSDRKRRAASSPQSEIQYANIERLEAEIRQSRKNYNNLASLIALAFPGTGAQCNDAAILALCRCFGRILVDGALESRNDMTKAELAVHGWLRKKYSEFSASLLSLLREEHYSSNLNALDLIMRLVKQEVLSLGVTQWTGGIFTPTLRSILDERGHSAQTKNLFVKTHFKYDDIRYYTALAIPKLLEETTNTAKDSNLVDTFLELLLAFPLPPSDNAALCSLFVIDEDDNQRARLSRKQYMRKVQDAWLAVLRMPLSTKQRNKVLGLLTHQIVPWFSQPERFMDFLTDSYNQGGETTLLALSGLFYLMQEKNLDYSSFFIKLYSLLDENILHSKHRSRFFRLLDTFMASTHLPAALVASFVKRLARLALYAPPSGIVMVIPWAYNMFQRHPSTTFMMHRAARCKEDQQEWELYGAEEPFDMTETDPMCTGAIDSSIWELFTLQSHYHPNVATLAKIISEQFTKQQYNLEDFLDHSYDSLLDAELEKSLRKSAVVEYIIPPSILREEEGYDHSLADVFRMIANA